MPRVPRSTRPALERRSRGRAEDDAVASGRVRRLLGADVRRVLVRDREVSRDREARGGRSTGSESTAERGSDVRRVAARDREVSTGREARLGRASTSPSITDGGADSVRAGRCRCDCDVRLLWRPLDERSRVTNHLWDVAQEGRGPPVPDPRVICPCTVYAYGGDTHAVDTADHILVCGGLWRSERQA